MLRSAALLVTILILLQFAFPGSDLRVAPGLFNLHPIAALDSLQRPAHRVKGFAVHFEHGALREVGIRVLRSAKLHVGESAEIVAPRIVGALLDGRGEQRMGLDIVPRVVRVHTAAVQFADQAVFRIGGVNHHPGQDKSRQPQHHIPQHATHSLKFWKRTMICGYCFLPDRT